MNEFDPNAGQQNANVILSADAKPFEKALDGSVQKYREFAKKVEERSDVSVRTFRANAEKLASTFGNAATGGAAGEFLEKLKEGGKAAAVFLGVQKAVEKVVEIAKKFNPVMKEWQRDLAVIDATLQKGAASFSRQLADNTRALNELGGARVGGTEEKRILELRQKALELRRKELSEQLAATREQKNALSERGLGSRILDEFGGTDSVEQFKELEQRAAALEEALFGLREEAIDTGEKLRKIVSPDASTERRKAVDEMIEDIRRQKYAVGQTEEQVKLLQMRMDGFSAKQIQVVSNALDELTAIKREQEISDITKELQKQADTFGKSANEVKLYDLAQKGYTEAQLERVRKEMMASEALIAQKQRDLDLLEQVRQYNEDSLKVGESGLVGAAAGGSSAAANAIAAARADTSRFANATPEQKAEMTRQAQLREQVKTVAETQKLVAKMGELITLFEDLGTR